MSGDIKYICFIQYFISHISMILNIFHDFKTFNNMCRPLLFPNFFSKKTMNHFILDSVNYSNHDNNPWHTGYETLLNFHNAYDFSVFPSATGVSKCPYAYLQWDFGCVARGVRSFTKWSFLPRPRLCFLNWKMVRGLLSSSVGRHSQLRGNSSVVSRRYIIACRTEEKE